MLTEKFTRKTGGNNVAKNIWRKINTFFSNKKYNHTDRVIVRLRSINR